MAFVLTHPEAEDCAGFTVVDVLSENYLCYWHNNRFTPPLKPYRKGPNFQYTPSDGEGVLCGHCGAKVDFNQNYGKVMKVVVEGGQVHHFYSHYSVSKTGKGIENVEHWHYWQHSDKCTYCYKPPVQADSVSFAIPDGPNRHSDLGENYWHTRQWLCSSDCCCQASTTAATHD